MLSTFATLSVNSAKHLDAHRDRPFAAAQGDKKGPSHSMTYCHAEHIRYAQCKLREASRRPSRQTLRFAQGEEKLMHIG